MGQRLRLVPKSTIANQLEGHDCNEAGPDDREQRSNTPGCAKREHPKEKANGSTRSASTTKRRVYLRDSGITTESVPSPFIDPANQHRTYVSGYWQGSSRDAFGSLMESPSN
jgi:hypothetical protein